MASSNNIPNLKTLLGARRGGGSYARNRGRDASGFINETSELVKDDAIRGTDQDAAGSRMSCVALGYLHDPYAKWFATQPSVTRLPLLNRGTYVRTSAIDKLITNFLLAEPNIVKQIISLGAGTDTRFFRLCDLHPSTRFIYHEIDFPTNTAAKIAAIQKQPLLNQKLINAPSETTCYHSETYNIHALDLRSLAKMTDGTQFPSIPNLDPSVPTLILSEMCLAYLQPSTVQSLMSSLLTHYLHPTTSASLVLYEPILPQDAFGRTMIANLKLRNIYLPTLAVYPELSDQCGRLREYGFTATVKAADTSFIWRDWIKEDEKERVAGLEFLDELEELDLLLKHYSMTWGWRDGEDGVFSNAWAELKGQAES